MAKPPKLADDRALRLLDHAPDGHIGVIIIVHGFSPKLLAKLIGDGLVTARHVARDGLITDDGRKALRWPWHLKENWDRDCPNQGRCGHQDQP